MVGVEQFKYLGSKMTDDGRCIKDLRAGLAMGKTSFTKKKLLPVDFLKVERISEGFCLVLSNVCRGTWTIGRREAGCLESFEIWIWRRV